jgi:hypothetical protein
MNLEQMEQCSQFIFVWDDGKWLMFKILNAYAAWYSEEAMGQLQRFAAEEVARVLRGEPMKNLLARPARPRTTYDL